MSDYIAVKFLKGEWGVFHKPTRNYCIFGKKKQIKLRAEQLNREKRKCT
jgi:hypothetical protein